MTPERRARRWSRTRQVPNVACHAQPSEVAVHGATASGFGRSQRSSISCSSNSIATGTPSKPVWATYIARSAIRRVVQSVKTIPDRRLSSLPRWRALRGSGLARIPPRRAVGEHDEPTRAGFLRAASNACCRHPALLRRAARVGCGCVHDGGRCSARDGGRVSDRRSCRCGRYRCDSGRRHGWRDCRRRRRVRGGRGSGSGAS